MDKFSVKWVTPGLVEAIDAWFDYRRGQLAETDFAVQMTASLFHDDIKLPQPPNDPPTAAEREALLQIAALNATPDATVPLPQLAKYLDTANGYFRANCFAEIDTAGPEPDTVPWRLNEVPANSAVLPESVYQIRGRLDAPAPDYSVVPPQLPAAVAPYWDPPAPQYFESMSPGDSPLSAGGRAAPGGSPDGLPDPAEDPRTGPGEPEGE